MEAVGVIYVVIAGFCWGIIGIFTRFLSGCGLSSVQITLVRNLVAAAGMLLLIMGTDKTRLKIRLRDIWMFVGTGICSVAFFNICYFKAIEITTLSVAAVLLYTAPCIVVALSAVFLGESFTLQKGLALVIAFLGCICTTGVLEEAGSISIEGIITGLGAGFGYALYSIFGNIALRRYHPFTVTGYTFLFAACALLPMGDIYQIAELGCMPRAALIYGLLGIVSTLLPFLLYTKGMERMDVGKASVMAYTEPLVATLCGIILFGEKLTIDNVLGMILIFISMVLLNMPVEQWIRRER